MPGVRAALAAAYLARKLGPVLARKVAPGAVASVARAVRSAGQFLSRLSIRQIFRTAGVSGLLAASASAAFASNSSESDFSLPPETRFSFEALSSDHQQSLIPGLGGLQFSLGQVFHSTPFGGRFLAGEDFSLLASAATYSNLPGYGDQLDIGPAPTGSGKTNRKLSGIPFSRIAAKQPDERSSLADKAEGKSIRNPAQAKGVARGRLPAPEAWIEYELLYNKIEPTNQVDRDPLMLAATAPLQGRHYALDAMGVETAVSGYENQYPGVTRIVSNLVAAYQVQNIVAPPDLLKGNVQALVIRLELEKVPGQSEKPVLIVTPRKEKVPTFERYTRGETGAEPPAKKGFKMGKANVGKLATTLSWEGKEREIVLTIVFVPMMANLGEAANAQPNHSLMARMMSDQSHRTASVGDESSPSDHHGEGGSSGERGGQGWSAQNFFDNLLDDNDS